MISPLLKKRLITRRSTSGETPSSLLATFQGWHPLCLALILVCAPALAEHPNGRQAPLDRLKQRSASSRWQSAKRELSTQQKYLQPAPATELEAAPVPQPAAVQQVPVEQAPPLIVAPVESAQGWVPSTASRSTLAQEAPAPVAIPSAPRLAQETPESGGSPTLITEQPSGRPAPGEPVESGRTIVVPTPGRSQVAGEPTPVSGVDAARPVLKFPVEQSTPRVISSSSDAGRAIPVPPLPLEQQTAVGAAPVMDLAPGEKSNPIYLADSSVIPPEPSNDVPADLAAKFRPIRDIVPSSSYQAIPTKMDDPKPDFPAVTRLPELGSLDRYFAPINYQWQPTNLFHNPLYFEDVGLERYGHTYPEVVQPFVSVGKFGLHFAALPYKMALAHPCNKEYTLGYLEPGDCNPTLMYQVPLDLQAAGVAAGAYTGLIFLFP